MVIASDRDTSDDTTLNAALGNNSAKCSQEFVRRGVARIDGIEGAEQI